MSVLDRYSKAQIKKHFTHVGWVMACPVYLNLEAEPASLDARNWVPEFWLTLNQMLDGLRIWLTSSVYEDYEPSFMLRVTGEIE